MMSCLRCETSQNHPGRGQRDRNRTQPGKGREELASAIDLGLADEEGKAAAWGYETGGDGQGGVEALDGTEGHELRTFRQIFGAAAKYIDIRQCKCTYDLAQEDGLLLVGLDQREAKTGRPDLDRQPREASARA